MIIECKGLVKEYKNGFRALNGISFNVKEGDIVGLVGPNGAGKTTLIKILAKILSPTSFETLNVNSEDVALLLSVEQLYYELTGQENIEFFLSLYKKTVHRDEINTILEKFDLLDVKDRLVGKYSFGMKQKLNLARSILIGSRLVILDEPTNGLDPSSIRDYYESLLKLQSEGITIVLSSHNMNEIEELCTQLIMINKGEIVINALKENLFENYMESIESFITRKNYNEIREIMMNFDIEYCIKKEGINYCVVCFDSTLESNEIFLKLDAIEHGTHKMRLEDIYLYETEFKK